MGDNGSIEEERKICFLPSSVLTGEGNEKRERWGFEIIMICCSPFALHEEFVTYVWLECICRRINVLKSPTTYIPPSSIQFILFFIFYFLVIVF